MKRLIFTLVVLLFSAAALAQELPKIAVYVTGNVGTDEKKALGTRMLASLVNSGRYVGIERSSSFLAEIEKEQVKQRSGAIDDNQISELGRQFGVKFICIADITPAFGEFQVSARIVNVETAVVAHIGEASGQLASMADLSRVSDNVVENMFGGKTTPAPVVPAPVPAPVQTPPAVAVSPAESEHNPYKTNYEEPLSFRREPDIGGEISGSDHKVSIGVAGIAVVEGGGGMSGEDVPDVTNEYVGFGLHVYIDIIYAELFAAIQIGRGEEGEQNSNSPDRPTLNRRYMNFGAFLKYPFEGFIITHFPLVGIDYEMSTSVDYGAYKYSGIDAGGLSALWFKFGYGIDLNPVDARRFYGRYELLLGWRMANKLEETLVDTYGGTPNPNFGITLKIGFGFKF